MLDYAIVQFTMFIRTDQAKPECRKIQQQSGIFKKKKDTRILENIKIIIQTIKLIYISTFANGKYICMLLNPLFLHVLTFFFF